MTLSADVQRLELGSVVTLYILDAEPIGAETYHFHSHDAAPITWQGVQYDPWQLEASGFEMSGSRNPSPKLKMGNVGGFITALCLQFDDLVGATLTRKRTLAQYALASAMDVQGVQLPRRQIIANYCPWRYRGAECGYTGPPVADEFDIITTDAARDKCGKRLQSCKLRFGEHGQLSFGGFPAAALTR